MTSSEIKREIEAARKIFHSAYGNTWPVDKSQLVATLEVAYQGALANEKLDRLIDLGMSAKYYQIGVDPAAEGSKDKSVLWWSKEGTCTDQPLPEMHEAERLTLPCAHCGVEMTAEQHDIHNCLHRSI